MRQHFISCLEKGTISMFPIRKERRRQKKTWRRKEKLRFTVFVGCLNFQLQNWLNAHCARSGFTSHAWLWMKTLLCAIPYGTVETVWHESWQLAIMLHIIIVLGGTVFTEGGHYSLVNWVLGRHYSLVNSVRGTKYGGDQIHYDTGMQAWYNYRYAGVIQLPIWRHDTTTDMQVWCNYQ